MGSEKPVEIYQKHIRKTSKWGSPVKRVADNHHCHWGSCHLGDVIDLHHFILIAATPPTFKTQLDFQDGSYIFSRFAARGQLHPI